MMVAHHLAYTRDPVRGITAWLPYDGPWMLSEEVEQMIGAAMANPRRCRADTLAQAFKPATRRSGSRCGITHYRLRRTGPRRPAPSRPATKVRKTARARSTRGAKLRDGSPREDYLGILTHEIAAVAGEGISSANVGAPSRSCRK